jgi:hypothetical protein
MFLILVFSGKRVKVSIGGAISFVPEHYPQFPQKFTAFKISFMRLSFVRTANIPRYNAYNK